MKRFKFLVLLLDLLKTFYLFILVSRDKPKRYSSQRQKTGTSMMDIPAQIGESDETRQYLEHLSKLYTLTCSQK